MNKNVSHLLPKGWIIAKLSDMVIDPKSDFVDGPFGSNLKANEYQNQGIPVFRIQNIKAGYFLDKNIKFVSEGKAEELKRHSFQLGDIIITKLGEPLGLGCKVPGKYPYGIIVADLMRVRPSELIVDTEYLVYVINSKLVQDQFIKITKGTTRSRVNLTIVRDILIPVPPLNEQKRIVSKLDEVFSALEKSKEQILICLKQLKVYKQAVLKSAFEGKLTNNLDTNQKWETFSLNSVCTKITDGSHFSPTSIAKGYPYVTVKDIKNDIVDFETCLKISKDDYLKLAENGCRPALNDILFSKDGTVGKVSLVNYEREFVILSSLAIIRPNTSLVDPKYLFYVLKSTHFLNQALDQKKGVAIRRIVLRDLRNLTLTLPPSIIEQRLIVSKLDSAFTICDELEKELNRELRKSDVLKQTIMQKAFDGTLTMQNSNDEYADILLERVKTQRETFLQVAIEKKRTKTLPVKAKKMAEELKNILEILYESKEPVSAKNLWQLSKQKDDIEGFYAELKKHIEVGEVMEVLPREGKESFLKLVTKK